MSSRTARVETVRGFTPEFGSRMAVIIHKLGGVNVAAAAADTGAETIRNWRDGRSEPKAFALTRLASEARVSLDWLLSDSVGALKLPRMVRLLTAKKRAHTHPIDWN